MERVDEIIFVTALNLFKKMYLHKLLSYSLLSRDCATVVRWRVFSHKSKARIFFCEIGQSLVK